MAFHRLHGLIGYWVLARDGHAGTVSDLLFDDHDWELRWVVVETRAFVSRRKVLLPPQAMLEPDTIACTLPICLTCEQVEESPDVRSDPSISRQMENQYADYYRTPKFWGTDAVWGLSTGYPASMVKAPSIPQDLSSSGRVSRQPGDPHLRSLKSILGYGIESIDERFGHVEDLIASAAGWTIPYLLIDTRNWWPSRAVIVPTNRVESISWHLSKLRLDVSGQVVRDAPVYDIGQPFDERTETEIRSYFARYPRDRGAA